MKLFDTLRSLFGVTSPPAQTLAPTKQVVAPPAPRPIEEWENYDKATQHFFDILGAPKQHISSNRAYKTWAVEFELSDALEKIEQGAFPEDIAALFTDMITAFQDALDSGDHDNFRQKSNYFTIAYSFSQFEEKWGYQDHRLSIGCPIGMISGPRFKTSMTKFSSTTKNLGENSGVWIDKETVHPNLIMSSGAPRTFDNIARRFFQRLEQAYNPEYKPDASQKFVIGGAYGPSGYL